MGYAATSHGWQIPRTVVLLAVCALLMAPQSSTIVPAPVCQGPEFGEDLHFRYPDLKDSPLQSVESYSDVFWAKVRVPARKCGTDYCAGLQVIRRVKGGTKGQVAVRIRGIDNRRCSPERFLEKGERWLVFGNRKIARGGTRYIALDHMGPSFPSRRRPNMETLERKYIARQQQLEHAIHDALNNRQF